MEMPGTERFPGQDHTRRSSQIAGSAIAEMIDRTTYLEGIVQARETEIVDLMERIAEMDDSHETAITDRDNELTTLREWKEKAERVHVHIRRTVAHFCGFAKSIHEKTRGNGKVGRQSQAVMGLRDVRVEGLVDLENVKRLGTGQGLTYREEAKS